MILIQAYLSIRKKEDELESVFKDLKSKHDKYSLPVVVSSGLYDDMDSPPDIPSF